MGSRTADRDYAGDKPQSGAHRPALLNTGDRSNNNSYSSTTGHGARKSTTSNAGLTSPKTRAIRTFKDNEHTAATTSPQYGRAHHANPDEKNAY
jgi:hypothetical protein